MKHAIATVVLLSIILIPFSSHAFKNDAVGQPQSEQVRIQKLSIEDRKNVEAPTTIVYKTKYNKYTEVSFDHKIHSESYGIKCIECHHVEKCAHCHGDDTASMMVKESKIALHETCLGCHRMMESGPRKCSDCHKKPAK